MIPIQKTFLVDGHEVCASFSSQPNREVLLRVQEILTNSAFAVADQKDGEYNGDVHLDNSTSHTKIPLSEIERSIQ